MASPGGLRAVAASVSTPEFSIPGGDVVSMMRSGMRWTKAVGELHIVARPVQATTSHWHARQRKLC
jgi:hypothetical protein